MFCGVPGWQPAPAACGGFDWLAQRQTETPPQVPGAVLWAGPGCADHAGVAYPRCAASHRCHLHQEAAQGSAGGNGKRKCTCVVLVFFLPHLCLAGVSLAHLFCTGVSLVIPGWH